MLDNNTASKLREMKMGAMADAFQRQLNDTAISELSFEERVGLMVDAWMDIKKKQPAGKIDQVRWVCDARSVRGGH